jgi:hypothetical protein
MENRKLLLFAFIGLFLIPSQMFAADLPAIVVVYSDIVTNIVTKVVVGIVVLIMLVISAWEMKENGNLRPFKWAVFASVVMGGAVFFGPSIIDYMSTQVGALTGDAAVVTTS